MTWLVDADVKEPVIETGVNASGGTESVININGQAHRLHTFTSSGELLVFSGGMVEVLAVGAGGGGGLVPESGTIGATNTTCGGGGAGGGGVVNCNLEVFGGGGFLGEYDITVGAGGSGVGGDSAIVTSGVDQVRAKGGGHGANFTAVFGGVSISTGGNGASSGGGGFLSDVSVNNFQFSFSGDRIFGQGNVGSNASIGTSGGGGGVTQAAPISKSGFSDPAELAPPNGGNGFGSSITGTLQYYGGGGGGGTAGFTAPQSFGGLGGGGNGAVALEQESAPGTNGTGGGGGGGGAIQGSGSLFFEQASNGGSGIVIIRYPIGV